MIGKEKLFLCTFELKHKKHSLCNKDFVKTVSASDKESAKSDAEKELKQRFDTVCEYKVASTKIEEIKPDKIIEEIKIKFSKRKDNEDNEIL